MADRSVATTDTLEVLRTTYNSTAGDVGDIATLNNAFSGTPTDVVEGHNKNLTSIGAIADLNNSFTGTPTVLVEAVNAKATQGFSVAMAVALG